MARGRPLAQPRRRRITMIRAKQIHVTAVQVAYSLLGLSSQEQEFEEPTCKVLLGLHTAVVNHSIKIEACKYISLYEADILTANLKEALRIAIATGGRANREVKVLEAYKKMIERVKHSVYVHLNCSKALSKKVEASYEAIRRTQNQNLRR